MQPCFLDPTCVHLLCVCHLSTITQKLIDLINVTQATAKHPLSYQPLVKKISIVYHSNLDAIATLLPVWKKIVLVVAQFKSLFSTDISNETNRC